MTTYASGKCGNEYFVVGAIQTFIVWRINATGVSGEVFRTLHRRKWLVELANAWSLCLQKHTYVSEDKLTRYWSV